MRLPDAEGFCRAVAAAIEGHDEVFIHDIDEAPFAVILPITVYEQKVSWKELPAGDMPNHDHIEIDMGEEVPWASMF